VLASSHPQAPGIAPGVEIFSYRASAAADEVEAAIESAIRARCDLISCSFTVPRYPHAAQTSALLRRNRDTVLMLVSAGRRDNASDDFAYAIPEALIVTSCDRVDLSLVPSPNSYSGPGVHIAVPVSRVRALNPDGEVYPGFAGSSAATAIATGAAALLLSVARRRTNSFSAAALRAMLLRKAPPAEYDIDPGLVVPHLPTLASQF